MTENIILFNNKIEQIEGLGLSTDLIQDISFFLANGSKAKLLGFFAQQKIGVLSQILPHLDLIPELKSLVIEVLIKRDEAQSTHVDLLNSQISLLDSELNDFLSKYNKIKEQYGKVEGTLKEIASMDENLERLDDATTDSEVELIEDRAKIIELAKKTNKERFTDEDKMC